MTGPEGKGRRRPVNLAQYGQDFGPDTALVVVDLQNDFCPGGALAVPDGDRIIPLVNRWVDRIRDAGGPIVYTQDWHPANHISFRERGGPWPPHCVQGTPGAELAPGLDVDGPRVLKGFIPDEEAYSGFDGVVTRAGEPPVGPRLADWLRDQGVRRLIVVGLATDYCVQATVLDGLAAGFRVAIDREGCRAVNVRPDDGKQAITRMLESGAELAVI
jgi:nicotinamidase/pyrazinamidase